MQLNLPLTRDLVLVGGGHAHALVLRKWAMNPQPGVRVTVINPAPIAAYTGMLPGLVAGHYARADVLIDLVRLCRFAGARLVIGAATGIDRDRRLIHVPGRTPVRYDIASLDVGVHAGPDDLDGIAHATPARPLDRFAAGWDAFLARAQHGPRVVIIGGGVAGVELALCAAHRLRDAAPSIIVIDAGTALAAQSPRAAAHLRRAMTAAGITLRENAMVTKITKDALHLADGTDLPIDFTIAVAGAAPQRWLAGTGLALHNGFVTVSPSLQTSDPAIFAAGDCAHLAHAPRPKAGVFAVRAAPVLHDNLRAALSGGPLRDFHPQRDYMKLISLGPQNALFDRNGVAFAHPALWRIKDRIDRAFMDKLSDFPIIPAPAIPSGAAEGLAEVMGAKPLCGGCGAKVGADALREALSNLPAPRNPAVLSGPGDDAAILQTPAGVQVMTTDHLRAFTNDAWLMARVAAVHALGDIWAMGATPQVALAQVTLPRLSPALQAAILAEIMAGAAAIFGPAGADIVGGHTSVGAELTIGFTVTGTAVRPILKGGAQPGDALILTKAIGSGVIMAAEMALARAPDVVLGEAVAHALTRMQHPLGMAAAILAPHAHAMTDVTGFGLAGHLHEMALASGVAATLTLADVPLLPGALALSAAGHASTLAPANRAALAGVLLAPDTAQAALVFDPQTAGGLLAAVPADQSQTMLTRLHDAGEEAAIIGYVTKGTPAITAR
jgi:selenide, water dikinase